MGMLICRIKLMLIMVGFSMSQTRIRTFDKVNVKENVGIGRTVVKLNEMQKMFLLNLSGFERSLFEIVDGKIVTRSEIDREEMLLKKWCFDRRNCLIELHVLINDGEEYWVIPMEILDENDNKPEFKEGELKLKFVLNNLNENKMLIEGAKDEDEVEEWKRIYYLLDCSKEAQMDLNWNERTKNCYPMFDLMIFSRWMLNENDQLGIKLNPSSLLLNEYRLTLFAFNKDAEGRKVKVNSMKILIEIEKVVEAPRFVQSVYRFVVLDSSTSGKKNKKKKIGEVLARSNDRNNKIVYRLKNETNDFEMNERSGEIYLLRNELKSSEIVLVVEGFYESNVEKKSLVNVNLVIRDADEMKDKLKMDLKKFSSKLKRRNESNVFVVDEKDKKSLEKDLFEIWILNEIYPQDEFDVFMWNSSLFRTSPGIDGKNKYFIELTNSNEFLRSSATNFQLILRVAHRLTNEFVGKMNLTLIIQSSLCVSNEKYSIFDSNRRNELTIVEVMESKENLSSFSQFSIVNENEIFVDECRMKLVENSSLNFTESQYEICSSSSDRCFRMSLVKEKVFGNFKRILKIRPVEITILCFSLIFILSSITLIIVICHLRDFRFCLSIKNYFFYGKKYGLNHSQHLHKYQINNPIHSIVVRESQSSILENIKSLEPYLFTLNQVQEKQENFPQLNLDSADSDFIGESHSYCSSVILEENDLHKSNSSPKSNQQSLHLNVTNEQFHLSQLASDV